MLDSFTITLFFIIIAALISAFSRRVKRDKCLYDFNNDPVSLEKITGKITAKGILNVENTGLEFIYPKEIKNEESKLVMCSYIFYKYEYPQIQALIRFHDELSEEGKKKREKELKITYKPSVFRRFRRKTQNISKTISDSLKEVGNAMLTHLQKGKNPTLSKSNDKYLKQINQNIVESVGSAYDPLLEKYIGHKIVFDFIKSEKVKQYTGILKNYTTNYIEILDVMYDTENNKVRLADIIIPQQIGIIRHLGESQEKISIKIMKDLKKWIKTD